MDANSAWIGRDAKPGDPIACTLANEPTTICEIHNNARAPSGLYPEGRLLGGFFLVTLSQLQAKEPLATGEITAFKNTADIQLPAEQSEAFLLLCVF